MNVVIYLLLSILPNVSLSYLAGTSKGNYSYGVQYCESLGTTIASIHSAAQFERARELCQQTVNANNGQSGCYIGLRMNNSTKTWSWEDGSPIDYGFYSDNNATTGILPWNTNEPSSVSNGKEPCVNIWKSNGYKYNDRTCYGIKEFPLCNDIPMQYTAGSSKGNYSFAVDYCESIGLSIASIHSWQDYQNAKTECQRTVTTNSGTSGCYIGLRMDNSTKIWSWEDGSDIDYGFDAEDDPATGVLPWNTNEPNNINTGKEPCVNLWKSSGYKYNDRTCYGIKEFPLCNNPIIPTSEPSSDPTLMPTISEPTTSTPTADLTESRTYIAGSITGNYSHAVDYCESMGLSIASIHSFGDYENAKKECQRTVNANGGQSGCYIGLRMDNLTKIWSWQDGSDIDYGFYAADDPAIGVIPWNTNEPSSVSTGKEPCVNIWKLNGYKYNDRTCYGIKEFPLCNNETVIITTSEPSSESSLEPTFQPTLDDNVDTDQLSVGIRVIYRNNYVLLCLVLFHLIGFFV